MTLTDDLIRWESYLADVVAFYRTAISQPLARILDRIANSLAIDLDWIPPWFYDYLPIASVFTFGILHALAEREGTNQVSLFLDLVREMYQELRRDFWETLFGLVIILVLGLFLALTAPAFAIVLPCLVIAYFAAGIALVVVLYGSVIVFALHRVIPLLAVVLLLVLAIWLFVSEASLYRALGTFRRNAARTLVKARHRTRKAWRRAPEVIPRLRAEARSGSIAYAKLIITQYRVAGVIGFLFLIIVGVNYALIKTG